MDIILSYFFKGSDPNLWIGSKVTLAFMGGLGAYLVKSEFFNSPGETKMNFKHGFIYSTFGMLAGICMINPPTALNSFAAGLIGVTALLNFTKQYNKGGSDTSYTPKSLSKTELIERQNEDYHE